MRKSSFLAFALSVAMVGCTTSSLQPFGSLGELQEAIAAAEASSDPAVRLDTDGDGIPDGVEERLGTNAEDRDTDHDGLVDNFEIFGSGDFDPNTRLPDRDLDGRIAPIDSDDDGDGRNDGELVDSDEDGIPNYLEFYGYTYDWLTGTFTAWDGDPLTPHYNTDPLQFSTDQDAFSDSTEVTGIGLDVSILPPGDHPLVPAIPNIVIELVGYSVTLNEDITYEEGRSLANGQTWSRETSQSHSETDERSWETGVEAGYAGGSGHVLVHANYGESHSNTHTSSTAVARGGWVLTEQQWSTARSVNPIDAARIKLYVKVHNMGGAPVSNVIPTITLKIGGLNIATFEPGNAQINMLVPGESYPDDPTVEWVIDSIDTGAGIAPIALTMTELRALESGAPVGISVTQLLGDVMRLDADGIWQRVGDVNEHLARCDAVSANIRIDLGDGHFVHHLVHANDSASAPRMTLRQALTLLGVDDEAILHFEDTDGSFRSVSLENYAFAIDTETLQRNGWRFDGDDEAQPPEGFVLDDLELQPRSSVLVRAPRETAGERGPVIHFAYVDLVQSQIKACTTDYQGIVSADVQNEEGDRSLPLTEDIPGAGYYTGLISGAPFDVNEPLTLVVTNSAGETAEQPLGSLFVQPGPREPIIRTVTLDLANKRVYANVESGAPSDPASALEWVRIYHGGLPGGAIDLLSVINSFEDPNGFIATLPADFNSTNVEIIAYTAPGVFSRHRVTATETIESRVAGTVTLGAVIDTTGAEEDWWVPAFDLDDGLFERPHRAGDDWNNGWNPPPPFDLWVRVDQSHDAWLYFNGTYARVSSGTDFNALTRADIDALSPSETGRLQLRESVGIRAGDIFAIQTSDGRYAKVRATAIDTENSAATNRYWRTLVLEYLTFEFPGG